MECPKCCLPICCETDSYIMCESNCFRSYHTQCIGLSEASVRCLSRNIIWLCDECLASFHGQNSQVQRPENVPTKIDLELADVKEKIANILETLSTITPQLSMTQPREASCSTRWTARHSTPTSSPPLRSGSKLVNGSLAEHSPEYQHSVDENCVSLFLTNIDGSATEEEVSRMVAESLDVDEPQKIEVLKLVPKWKVHYQPYVSFKITVDIRFKRTALQSDTWPAGIMFREFVEQPRRTWIPPRQERKQR